MPHGFEYLLGDLAGNGVICDAFDHAAEVFRRYRRLSNDLVFPVQCCGEFAHDPVG